MTLPYELIISGSILTLAAILENRCSAFNYTFPQDYDKFTVPPGKDGDPLNITFSLFIERIVDIDTKNNLVSVDMWCYFSWFEERLSITNDSSGVEHITLRTGLEERFWKPTLFVWLMKGLTVRKGARDCVRMVVYRNKKLLLAMAVTVETSCEFEFKNFPFDVQTCRITAMSYPDTMDKLRLQWASEAAIKFASSSRTDMRTPQYILNLVTKQKPLLMVSFPSKMSALAFCIVMRRQITSFFLEIFFPSGLFVVMSWGSFLISPEVVPGRMVLLVTNLLTLVTMFEAIRGRTPTSLSIKAVDIWLLSCIMFVFCALVEYAFILLALRQRETNQRKEVKTVKVHPSGTTMETMQKVGKTRKFRLVIGCWKSNWSIIDSVSLVLFPTAFVVYNVAYWSTYMSRRNHGITNSTCS